MEPKCPMCDLNISICECQTIIEYTNYPTSINILGTVYEITYFEKAHDVDFMKRKAHSGAIDYWDKKINIHNSGNHVEMWKTIMHEILHGISEEANIKMLDNDDNHSELDLLSKVLVDIIIRNEINFLENKRNG